MTDIEYDACEALINISKTLNSNSSIDWEQRRYEVAKDMFNSLVKINSSSDITKKSSPSELVDISIEFADEFINKLKSHN